MIRIKIKHTKQINNKLMSSVQYINTVDILKKGTFPTIEYSNVMFWQYISAKLDSTGSKFQCFFVVRMKIAQL